MKIIISKDKVLHSILVHLKTKPLKNWMLVDIYNTLCNGTAVLEVDQESNVIRCDEDDAELL
jgi:hypothetical protein